MVSGQPVKSLGESASASFDDSMEPFTRSAIMYQHLRDLREYHQSESRNQVTGGPLSSAFLTPHSKFRGVFSFLPLPAKSREAGS